MLWMGSTSATEIMGASLFADSQTSAESEFEIPLMNIGTVEHLLTVTPYGDAGVGQDANKLEKNAAKSSPFVVLCRLFFSILNSL